MNQKVTYLMRLWLPDRPGALSAVASRFGALKGDVVGLEIIERGGGVAVDELLVSFPSDIPVERIVRELGAEEGVHIEQIRPFDELTFDPELDVLDAATALLATQTPSSLAELLVERGCISVRGTWACLVGANGTVLGASGECPDIKWLAAFISGSPPVDRNMVSLARSATVDTIWIDLPKVSAQLVVGSDHTIRARECQRIAGLAAIADVWFSRLGTGTRLDGQESISLI